MIKQPTINYNYKIIKSGGYTELYIYHDRTMSRKDDSLKKLLDSWVEETKDVEAENEVEKEKREILENEQIKKDLVLTDKEKELIKKNFIFKNFRVEIIENLIKINLKQ